MTDCGTAASREATHTASRPNSVHFRPCVRLRTRSRHVTRYLQMTR